METPSQFFTPDSSGNSHPVAKIISGNTVDLESSHIRARNRQSPKHPIQSLAIDGVPGIPFEFGIPDPDVFYQGEDVIYDLFLVYDGNPVTVDKYDIKIGVKTSYRAQEFSFEASLDQGVYHFPEKPGYFELWIPNSITSQLFAGSYYINVLISDKIGQGTPYGDRKHILLQSMFNLEYSAFSPNPENALENSPDIKRHNLEITWPNRPNTIGQSRMPPNTVYAS
jgi:hypothetical protein